jgi:hypothetical protein
MQLGGIALLCVKDAPPPYLMKLPVATPCLPTLIKKQHDNFFCIAKQMQTID